MTMLNLAIITLGFSLLISKAVASLDGYSIQDALLGNKLKFPESFRKLQQSNPRPYHLLTPQQIKNQLNQWAAAYPNFVRVTTSQDKYGLPSAGRSSDCPFENGAGCRNYFATIQDYVAHPAGSASSKLLPEVLWSGALHGNERVGPTAVVETGSLLLAAASCEAQTSPAALQTCRAALLQQGINDSYRRWLARLVVTRRIIIVPTANALGYYQNIREENGVDPNRDFPYDVLDSRLCMQSIAARTLNEIFREHLIQLSLTFHAGTEVVAYEWGATSWIGYLSPDDTSQIQICNGYSRYAGKIPFGYPYEVGSSNDLVYDVRGGMEDWAYAGSWTPSKVITCNPQTFGGYAASKSRYNNATLRTLNILVETSYDKTPEDSTLGTSANILTAVGAQSSGHVARNIRLSLLSAELVEPYVSVVGVDSTSLTDKFPLRASRRNASDCFANIVTATSNTPVVKWTVGGAFRIADTQLWYARATPSLLKQLNCRTQPSNAALSQFRLISPIGSKTGTGFFSGSGPFPTPPSDILGPYFQAQLNLTGVTDSVVIMAAAKVDPSWAQQPSSGVAPRVRPQSHVVNARTNAAWRFESSGKVIQGRIYWYSQPVIIKKQVAHVRG